MGSYKELARRYFEGCITAEEEHRLYAFVRTSAANRAQLRAWEEEWENGHIPSPSLLESLSRLNMQIAGRSRRHYTMGRWLRLTAATAAIIIGTFFTTRLFIHTTDSSQLYTIEAPSGTNSHISLPDGTQVWLNAGSTLSYRSDFNRSSRAIALSGEAYFEVERNEGLPFRVTARGCSFTVLGTKFNISAYDEDPRVLAALIEGSLRFSVDNNQTLMTPGDLISFDCSTRQTTCEKANAEQYRNWINGGIRYDAISLPDLLRRLAREYDVDIELCTSRFDQRTFRISFSKNQTIESIMNGLCDILPINVTYDSGHYRVESRD